MRTVMEPLRSRVPTPSVLEALLGETTNYIGGIIDRYRSSHLFFYEERRNRRLTSSPWNISLSYATNLCDGGTQHWFRLWAMSATLVLTNKRLMRGRLLIWISGPDYTSAALDFTEVRSGEHPPSQPSRPRAFCSWFSQKTRFPRSHLTYSTCINKAWMLGARKAARNIRRTFL